MKYTGSIIAITLFFNCAIVYAQSDALKNGEPAGQDQRYWKEIPKDLPPIRDLAEVSKDTIPTRLRRTLHSSDLYNGWEDVPLYIDKNTGLYMLYFKKENTIIIYGFNENGKPITYDTYIKPEDN